MYHRLRRAGRDKLTLTGLLPATDLGAELRCGHYDAARWDDAGGGKLAYRYGIRVADEATQVSEGF